MKVIRESDGTWRLPSKIVGSHASYQPAYVKYLNILDSFFSKAKEVCEFEFIFTLLRVRGMSAPGWDGLKNLEQAHKTFYRVITKFKNDNFAVSQQSLFLYGLIIEASEPYELLANLINVIEGDRFSVVTNFPPKKGSKITYPVDKIKELKDRAKKIGLRLDLFDDFFDKELRNAIFHSDYTIHNNEIRLLDSATVYKKDKWHSLVNGALAYFEALLQIYQFNRLEYKGTELIEPHPGFRAHKDEIFVPIIRSGYGLTGLKDNWTPEQIGKGHIPHCIGVFSKYEERLIDKGVLILPKDRVERINKVLMLLPAFVSRIIVKLVGKYFR